MLEATIPQAQAKVCARQLRRADGERFECSRRRTKAKGERATFESRLGVDDRESEQNGVREIVMRARKEIRQ